MTGKNKIQVGPAPAYREVPVRPAIYTMLVVVAAVAAPLGWLNQKIGAEGFRIADTTQYQDLVAEVNGDVKTVQRMLEHAHVDEKNLMRAMLPSVVLITPNISPTNMGEAAQQGSSKFKIKLTGIYWSPNDPIVTINGENYHTGEMVQNHRIIEIRETEVVFEDPMGEKIVKYFYDYLGKPKNRH